MSQQKTERITIPHKRDYDLVFHETEPFKLSLNAQNESLSLILVSQQDFKMWRAEFKSEYLEDISRKTGRELTYLQFIQMVHDAIVAQNDLSTKLQRKHLFIDLLGYQDLQLLKAGKKGGLKSS